MSGGRIFTVAECASFLFRALMWNPSLLSTFVSLIHSSHVRQLNLILSTPSTCSPPPLSSFLCALPGREPGCILSVSAPCGAARQGSNLRPVGRFPLLRPADASPLA